ncbi:leucine-rich repeat domain-containing protein [Chloroflexota bacterium]
MINVKNYVMVIVLIIAFVSASCFPNINKPGTDNTNPNHNYFPENNEFVFRVTGANDAIYGVNQVNLSYSGIQAKYTSQDILNDELDGAQQACVYRFETVDTGSQINILIPAEVSDDLKLTTGIVYRIVYQIQQGWPTAYGLVIMDRSEVVFAGITDWRVNGNIKIDDSFLPILSPPIKIEQTKVLTDHFTEGSDSFERITNTEVCFSISGKSITLHQGEAAMLDNYKIRLLIARETKYRPGVLDAGINGVSYTILRIGGSAPQAATTPANEIVGFPDPALNNAIRNAIKLPNGNITKLDLAGLWYLDASKQGITDLSGLDKCAALRQLNLNSNQISDIFPLSGITGLERLELANNKIGDISALNQLTALKSLDLAVNQISIISALSKVVNLRTLNLYANHVSDVSPLSKLVDLEELVLHSNQIVDISPLNSLTKLRILGLSRNQINEIPEFSGLAQLSSLFLSWNNITDISPIASLTNLGNLHLSYNKIIDISPLRGLTQLNGLGLDNNQIVDISALGNLTALYDPSLDNNMITEIRPLLDNPGIGKGSVIYLRNNPLNETSREVYVPQLEARGVTIHLK